MKKNDDIKPVFLFAEILSHVMDTFNIRAADIYNDPDNKTASHDIKIQDTNISSWKKRNPPKSQRTFDHLCCLFKKILKDIPLDHHIKRSVFIKDIGDIFDSYNLSENWESLAKKDQSYAELIVSSLELAYCNKKLKRKPTDTTMVIISDGHKRIKKKRVVVFDLDGTLIKGIKYSWTLLYSAVGLSTEQCRANKKRFERGELSYPDWVRYDLKELKGAGLTKEIADNAFKSNCALTKNFREAIEMLKSANCAVGIISGGSDAALYSLIPDADELFDGNIYINRMIFDESTGRLSDIEATPFDWDDDGTVIGVSGKNEGLKRICKRYGVDVEKAVFIGDDDNDFKAMRIAGMKILYNSQCPDDDVVGTGIRQIPEGVKLVQKDDLMLIANIILSDIERSE